MAIIGKDIDRVIFLLKNNEIVGIPTETVYGLAGNALNSDSLLEIFKVKKRPKFNPIIAHTNTIDKILPYIKIFPKKIEKLARTCWPGSLTILFEKKNVVSDILTAGLDKVGFRIPNHPLILQVLKKIDFPLGAPSANIFGYVSPTTAEHVNIQLGNEIPYILDGGRCKIGIESTVIGICENEIILHRLGGTTVERIESIVGKVKLSINQSSNPLAPGKLKSHYAPNKKIIVGDLEENIKKYESKKIGIISFHHSYMEQHPFQIVLSRKKDLNEASRNLFSALRILDNDKVDVILTEEFPNIGLGRAINDRLLRASSA